jgi:hypothetical protein
LYVNELFYMYSDYRLLCSAFIVFWAMKKAPKSLFLNQIND